MAKETKQVLIDKDLADMILIIAANLKQTRQQVIDAALIECINNNRKFFPNTK